MLYYFQSTKKLLHIEEPGKYQLITDSWFKNWRFVFPEDDTVNLYRNMSEMRL